MSAIYWSFLSTLIPAFSALVGGAIGARFTPQKNLLSGLQHFAAGIIIAAVATELLPQILDTAKPLLVSVSFIAGVIAMFLIESFAHSLMHKNGGGLLAGACIDLFIDGLLIGVSFLGGLRSGFVIAVSLSFCAFFLSLTVLTTLHERKMARLLPLLLLAVMLPVGGLLGGVIATTLRVEMISFGVAALLFLGVEELLGEAHKREDNVWISTAFFLGFLLVFLFNQGS